jgi:hypothetical protein
MRASTLTPPISRDPDNELYDRGCDLVEAAAAIRRAAGSREAGRAVPAVLGCMESALQELLCACDGLEQTTTELTPSATDCVDPRAKVVAHRMRRGYRNLREALSDAHGAAAAARSLAGRALHGGPLSSGGGR